MRKYRCNRILEDRKISRRLCAPFFFPLSYENGRGQRKVEQLSAPLLRFTGAPPKILFRTRMIRERIQRTGTGASFEFQRCFRRLFGKDTRSALMKTIPKLFLQLAVKARKRAGRRPSRREAGCDFNPQRAIVAFPA